MENMEDFCVSHYYTQRDLSSSIPPKSFHYSTYFSSAWRYKTFHFPVLFSRTFSNRNVWNAKLLALLIHDVIKHFMFPYFFPVLFQTATLKISVSCFSSTWRYKTFHFPVLVLVLLQTATFEMQRYLPSSTWRYKTFHFPVLFQTATFGIQEETQVE
jgi:hypothetical protein